MDYPEIQAFPQVDPMVDREAFVKLRAPYFGASSAATLFGENPYESAADLWLNKVCGAVVEETRAMRRGNHMEAAVANWFGVEYGLENGGPSRTVRKAEHMYVLGHLAATPDYWMDDDLVEIKTTAHTTDVPLAQWVFQVQAQMLCTGSQRAYIVWVDSTLNIQWEVIEANPDTQESIFIRSKAFMDAVHEEFMPEWIEREARHVIAMFPDPVDAIESGERGMELVADYWSHKSAAKHYEEAAAKCRDELFSLAGNHDTITLDGKEIATLWSRKLAASFNHKRFREDQPDMYLKYMNEASTTRVLQIPKNIKAAIELGAQ